MFPTGLPSTPRGCVDELEEIERLKAALCARQARLAAHFDELDASASDRSLGSQVGLARHESPHRGRRLLTVARALVHDHPEVLALLDAGEINEHRAELICAETADLRPGDRGTADREIARRITRSQGWGDRTVQLETRRIVLRIDQAAALRRRERAHAARHVATRSYGDGTAQVTGMVADHDMIAIMCSLDERAALLRAMGDDRTPGQIRADLFVERLTGQTVAASVPVAIGMVVPAETLLADGPEPAEIAGLGPIPASVARRLAHASPEQATSVRRLFADTDHLVAMESTSRTFDGLLRTFVTLRDRRCRTPWCDAPIRHADHVTGHADGGPTSLHNAQGLCENCNLTKEEPGWQHTTASADIIEAHSVAITTPAGHRHHSRAPDPPGQNPRDHYLERRPGVWTLAV